MADNTVSRFGRKVVRLQQRRERLILQKHVMEAALRHVEEELVRLEYEARKRGGLPPCVNPSHD